MFPLPPPLIEILAGSLCVVEEVGPALPFGEAEEGPPLIDTPGGNRGTDAVGRFLGEALGPPLILTPRPAPTTNVFV